MKTLASRSFALLWPPGNVSVRVRTCLSFLLVFAAQGAAVGAPLVYKSILDRLQVGPGLFPVFLIVVYGASRIIGQVAQSTRQLIFAPVIQRVVRITALSVFDHLHTLSLGFHLDRQTGGLPRIIDRGTSALTFLIELILFQLGPVVIELILVSAILTGFYGLRYTLIVVATIMAYVGFTAFVARRQAHVRRDMNRADVSAGIAMVDSILNYETVKYFGAEASERSRVEAARKEYEAIATRFERVRSSMSIGQILIIAIGSTSIMLVAGDEVAGHALSLGDFVLVNTYLLQLYAPLGALALIYTNFRQSVIDVEAMSNLLSIRPEIEDAPNAKPLVVTRGHIRFERVSFRYGPGRQILHDISFDIPPGKSVALVGASGGGKSTLAKLLFRFYEPTGGRITIDGQDIRSVTQNSLRAAIGVVPQDTVLFNETIGQNLAFADPNASGETLLEAAQFAQIHDAIMRMPAAYDTRVGERGLKLSGGEKQRVAIARTILKDPAILVLDEATSALDIHTEHAIQERLNAIARERTTLIIAHRLSTVADADTIIVIDRGKIAEQGSHAELIARSGLYAEMWRRQRKQRSAPCVVNGGGVPFASPSRSAK